MIKNTAFYEAIGALGGKSVTRAKQMASKRNGTLGGRPKGSKNRVKSDDSVSKV